VGTIQYLSPEYLEKGVVSAQGDVYALGVVAYELVTGAAPFGGLGVYEAIEAKVNGGAPDPRESENEISDELAEVIQRALSPRLQERFRSAVEFNRAIRSVSSRAIRGKRIHQSSRLGARGEDKSEITEISTQESRAVRGGRKIIALYVAVSVLIGMVVFSRWLMTNSRVGNPQGVEDGATSEANTYSITRVIPSSLLKKLKKEEDVYD
jgi:serine/threonine protein kinase